MCRRSFSLSVPALSRVRPPSSSSASSSRKTYEGVSSEGDLLCTVLRWQVSTAVSLMAPGHRGTKRSESLPPLRKVAPLLSLLVIWFSVSLPFLFLCFDGSAAGRPCSSVPETRNSFPSFLLPLRALSLHPPAFVFQSEVGID